LTSKVIVIELSDIEEFIAELESRQKMLPRTAYDAGYTRALEQAISLAKATFLQKLEDKA